MASVSASHLIIFIASLVIAAGVVGTLTTGVERVSSSIDDGSLDVSQQIRMDMSVISDPGADYPNNGTNVDIHVRNTGSQSVAIEESAIDVVFNGRFLGSGDFEVADANGNDNIWRPGGVIRLTLIDPDLSERTDHRLFLTVNGDEETFEFSG